MRGSLKLFADLLPKTTEEEVKLPRRSYRSAELHAARNKCLVARYYYYLKFSDRRYEAILEVLRQEFFIEKYTIQKWLTDCYDDLRELEKQAPKKEALREQWPHLVW